MAELRCSVSPITVGSAEKLLWRLARGAVATADALAASKGAGAASQEEDVMGVGHGEQPSNARTSLVDDGIKGRRTMADLQDRESKSFEG